MSVYGKFFYADDNLDDVYSIKNSIKNKSNDTNDIVYGETQDQDCLAIYAVVYTSDNEKKAVGTGKLFLKDDQYYVDEIYVTDGEENLDYDELVIRMLVNKAFDLGAEKIYTISSPESIHLFNKIGFKRCSDLSSDFSNNLVEMFIISEYFYRECCK